MPGAPLLRLTCARALRRLSGSTTASISGPEAAGVSGREAAVLVSVPCGTGFGASPFASVPKASFSWIFCRVASTRSPVLLPLQRSGLRPAGADLLCPLLTSAPRSPASPLRWRLRAIDPRRGPDRRRWRRWLSPGFGTRGRSPEVSSTAFTAAPPDLLSQALDGAGPRGHPPARPTWAASHPVLVHRVAALLHTAFRPHLAAMPLCFANPSSPSDWVEDLHLQAVEHARHTDRIDASGIDGSSTCSPMAPMTAAS